ncbi:hypothetical protein [Streptomyces sp. NPDC048611]|uniref:hypothetical protein n=1 Tax=Streptomyces sp. NPDC048611 TaxID=3155635 RepID=UPI00342FD0CA
MAEQKARAVVRLENLVQRVAPRDANRWEARPPLKRGRLVSASRALQLRATVKQLGVAVGHEEMPEGCGRSVQRLLAPEAIDVFLELAAEGAFRDPDKPALAGRPLSWSSLATLRDCLVILGEEVGIVVVVPRIYRQRLDLAPVPSSVQLDALYERVVAMARSAPVDAVMARALAVTGLVLDTRMRSGDVWSRRLEHLSVDDGGDAWVDAVWHAQNAAHLPVREERVPLRPGTAVAVRRWLQFRQVLVDQLEGSDHGALWVSTRSAQVPVSGGGWVTHLAGMPLSVRWLTTGFVRGMESLNAVLRPRWEGPGEWEPLPTRIEALRRGVEWAQEQAAGR